MGQSEDETKEWLRKSFLKVDEELETGEAKETLKQMRRDEPPKKPEMMQLLMKE